MTLTVYWGQDGWFYWYEVHRQDRWESRHAATKINYLVPVLFLRLSKISTK